MATKTNPTSFGMSEMGIVSVLGLCLLVAYCQVHSRIEQIDTPLPLSFHWALAQVAPWSALLGFGWSRRVGLRAAACDTPRAQMKLFSCAFLAALITDAIAFLFSPGEIAIGRLPLELFGRVFDFVPVAAILATLLLCGLLLLDRTRSAPAAVIDPGAWLALPEAPFLRVRKAQIALIRSAGNYSELVTADRAHLVRLPISEMATRLAGDGFIRVHRSAIVNLQRLREVGRASSGRLVVRLDDGSEVAVGRTFRSKLIAMTDTSCRSSLQEDVRP